MFIENEFIGILPFLRLLLAIIIGIAPIAITIVIKLVLYRRRLAEDEAERPMSTGSRDAWAPSSFCMSGGARTKDPCAVRRPRDMPMSRCQG